MQMADFSHTLKCFELNVNSLISKTKQHELNSFISQHSPDVLLLVETKLKNGKKISIPNYNIFRNDRSSDAGGGTAIILRAKFEATHLQCLHTINSFEYTVTKVMLESHKHVFFCAIYKKPSNKINPIELNLLINSFGTAQYVIGGDFNCKHTFWGNKDNDTEGNRLYNWLCDSIGTHKLNLLGTNNPTCIRANSESYLDLFIVEDSLNVNFEANSIKLDTYEFDSDHLAVALTITLNNRVKNVEPTKIYNWNKAEFKKNARFH